MRALVTAAHRRNVALLAALVLPIASACGGPPSAGLHLAANGNFGPAGDFLPDELGFNMADVTSPSDLAKLPDGVQALVWVGRCDGVTPGFTAAVQPYLGSSKVFGYYLIDEPDPTGQWKPACSPAKLAAESDYLHQHSAGRKTFMIMMNLGSPTSPTFVDRGAGYTPANTRVDLVGLDPYPCRSELNGCDYAAINGYVKAAEKAGWEVNSIVPVYQAFGGGNWVDSGGGHWLLPTAEQLATILSTWNRLVPNPVFDYSYSWGSQMNDTALSIAPASLRQVIAEHNGQRTGEQTGTAASLRTH
jgi:hypothetical protein